MFITSTKLKFKHKNTLDKVYSLGENYLHIYDYNIKHLVTDPEKPWSLLKAKSHWGTQKGSGQPCLFWLQWVDQEGFSRIAVNINIAAGAATHQALCFSPRWALVLCRKSHTNRQFKAPVRLCMSCWCLFCPRPWKWTLVFAFSTLRSFGSPPKSEELEAQSVDLCWSLGMHLKAPLAYSVCNPVTGLCYGILGQRPWQERGWSPVTL